MGGDIIDCLSTAVFRTLKHRSYEYMSLEPCNPYYPYGRDVNVLECEILHVARANRWRREWTTDTIWDEADYEAAR